MIILILGPQGSGKGTQARILANKLKLFYFESGEFLRQLARKNKKLEKELSQGKLVPNKEMASYVASFFDGQKIYDNILFDGFPRTRQQYNFFKKWLQDRNMSLDLVIVLQISEKETLRRLSTRRQDPKTGKIYNLLTSPLPDNIDPKKLIQRTDDKPIAIKERLKWYKSQVMPLIEQLKRETKVIEINGERSIDEIKQGLLKQVRILRNDAQDRT